MTVARALELLAVLATLVALFIGGYIHLNEYHAKDHEVKQETAELERQILELKIETEVKALDRDIKKDAEARVYYKDLADDRALEPAEQSRLEYLEEQLEYKYDEQRMWREQQMKLESE